MTVSKTSVFETSQMEKRHPASASLERGALVSKEVSEPIVLKLTGENGF